MNDSTKTPKQQYNKTQDFFTLYCNSVRMTIGLWDFRFNIGEVEEANEEVIRVSEKLSIVMSPQHAKMFLQVFQTNLGRYEEKFGEIKLPPGILVEGEAQPPTS
jgi:Protein of unknown function (DUF3467)